MITSTVLFAPERIFIDSTSISRASVLHQISELMAVSDENLSVENLFEAYWHRESLGSTAIGSGVAIPHICCNKISTPRACLLKLAHPVDFDAQDKQPAFLVIGLLVPSEQPQLHLKILSDLVKLLKQPEFLEACEQAETTEELFACLQGETTLEGVV